MIHKYECVTTIDMLSILKKHDQKNKILWYYKKLRNAHYIYNDIMYINMRPNHPEPNYDVVEYTVENVYKYLVLPNMPDWHDRFITIFSNESSNRNNRSIYS